MTLADMLTVITKLAGTAKVLCSSSIITQLSGVLDLCSSHDAESTLTQTAGIVDSLALHNVVPHEVYRLLRIGGQVADGQLNETTALTHVADVGAQSALLRGGKITPQLMMALSASSGARQIADAAQSMDASLAGSGVSRLISFPLNVDVNAMGITSGLDLLKMAATAAAFKR